MVKPLSIIYLHYQSIGISVFHIVSCMSRYPITMKADWVNLLDQYRLALRLRLIMLLRLRFERRIEIVHLFLHEKSAKSFQQTFSDDLSGVAGKWCRFDTHSRTNVCIIICNSLFRVLWCQCTRNLLMTQEIPVLSLNCVSFGCYLLISHKLHSFQKKRVTNDRTYQLYFPVSWEVYNWCSIQADSLWTLPHGWARAVFTSRRRWKS